MDNIAESLTTCIFAKSAKKKKCRLIVFPLDWPSLKVKGLSSLNYSIKESLQGLNQVQVSFVSAQQLREGPELREVMEGL